MSANTLAPPKEFTLIPNHAAAEAQRLLDAFFVDEKQAHRPSTYLHITLLPSVKQILSATQEIQSETARLFLTRLLENAGRTTYSYMVRDLIGLLLQRDLALPEEVWIQILTVCSKSGDVQNTSALFYFSLPFRSVLKHIKKHIVQHGLSDPLREALEAVRQMMSYSGTSVEEKRFADKIGEMTGALIPGRVRGGEVWSNRLLQDLAGMDSGMRSHWMRLLAHCGTCGKACVPSQKWLDTCRECFPLVGTEVFTRYIRVWFTLFGQKTNVTVEERDGDILRGLVLACAMVEDDTLCEVLGNLAEAAYRKYPGGIVRAQRVGNTCLYVLEQRASLSALAQIARLKRRVTFRTALRTIEDTLRQAAARTSIPVEEIEEMSVGTYGLKENGVLRETFGEIVAEAVIEGSHLGEWKWTTPDGKHPKSLPAAVRQNHLEAWQACKQNAIELQKALAIQRERLEELLRTPRSWSFAVWRERYLEQPLLRGFVERLLWHFTQGERTEIGIWHDGRLINGDGQSLEGFSDAAQVRLWHPLDSSAEEVRAWRVWLDEKRIQQPFKQAHREVYLLTDAEIKTNTYSNRFAAHILKQHQFKALCEQKGWRYRLYMGFDGSEAAPAVRNLPRWGLNAEFWVDDSTIEDMSESGAFAYVATDQVRFYRENEREPLPLTEVPPLVLSEILRDVDMFVAVASVGSDPNWRDSGAARTHQTYWHDYSFGSLNATAQIRRDVLERLLPRLKIAERAHLNTKFLVVRGDLRTYKIHLGSGNILMEPNDQYLCIVPSSRTEEKMTDGIFLPFEGDRTLSIILSKALLLAEDTKITDKTITRQITPA